MSRLSSCFLALKKSNKKALVPYFVAGDSSLEMSLALMKKSVEAGADVIELGVPFSDPMAEGPVIQLAHERALIHNTSLMDTLNLVEEFRQTDAKTPVVLMGYANPIEAMGYDRFADVSAKKGVDAVLVVDMPPEEAGPLQKAMRQYALDNIFLIAPTTSETRIADICRAASGYLYYVSLKGVTGAGHFDIESVKQKLSLIQQYTDLPVCVGFGIKDADSAGQVAAVADGVVVGSALVDRVSKGGTMASVLETVEHFMRSLRQAMDDNTLN